MALDRAALTAKRDAGRNRKIPKFLRSGLEEVSERAEWPRCMARHYEEKCNKGDAQTFAKDYCARLQVLEARGREKFHDRSAASGTQDGSINFTMGEA